MKLVDVKIQFLVSKQKTGKIEVRYMMADMFTKALAAPRLEDMRTRHFLLLQPIQVGYYVVIHDTEATQLSTHSEYNSHQLSYFPHSATDVTSVK
ncbi:hypothetical protein PsorP6_014409 [Peronosclerospora sorghi]|uniref:Uncharacterized protein n=1 Tax=Peronosclerospora sorghi TaxID=230839 RepID=A0ACC0VHZ6_9STRA|nr:hypothetical protein PsorP6_014409 [Peronosclerospora sorghi]